MSKRKFTHDLQTIALFTPGFVVYTMFILFSIVLCFYYSLFDWDGISRNMNFIGFGNYIRAFSEPDFLNSLGITAFFAILGTLILNVFGIGLSVWLNTTKFSRVYRTMLFLPQLISLVAVGFIFKGLLSYIGIVNNILEHIGLQKINFLGTVELAKWSVLFVSIWQSMGFSIILYFAGLQAIPTDLYDSAKIDGANGWQQFQHIIFPWLAPMITSVTVFIFTGYMKIFDFIYVLTSGGPINSTESVAVLIIRIGFNQFKVSYASALSIYFLILVSAVSMTMTHVLRKREELIIM